MINGKRAIICIVCGRIDESHEIHKLYCSDACNALNAHRKRKGVIWGNRQHIGQGLSRVIICIVCAYIFWGNSKALYCSTSCQRASYKGSRRHRLRLDNAERRYTIRMELIKMLGGKCVKCGIDEWRVLQINHINGISEHNPRDRDSYRFYQDVLKGKYKGQVDLRCANCNILHEYERGRRTDF